MPTPQPLAQAPTVSDDQATARAICERCGLTPYLLYFYSKNSGQTWRLFLEAGILPTKYDAANRMLSFVRRNAHAQSRADLRPNP